MHECIQSKSLTPADQCHESAARRQSTFPQESIALALRISLNGEHAAQVDGAADGAERSGKQVEHTGIDVQGCAEEYQLFRCQARVFLPASFVPGSFTYLADREQVPAAFQRWHSISLEEMAQANFMIIEVSRRASMVENEGVIWYHVSNLT